MLNAALFLGGGYLLLCLVIFALQRRLVYFPGPPPTVTPSAVGLEFDDLSIVTGDAETLHAWRVRAGGVAEGVVIHCHGNAGSIEHRIETARAFADMGLDCILFDYRGYGRSTGAPFEEGTYTDAEAVHDWAIGEGGYAAEKILIFGESLGGGVAVELARRREVAGLVLESSFTSIVDLGSKHYGWLPVNLLARDRYASIEKVGGLSNPILVLHGRGDEIIPFEHGEGLAKAAGVDLVELPGGHNSGGFLQRADLRRTVGEFFERALSASVLRSGAARQ